MWDTRFATRAPEALSRAWISDYVAHVMLRQPTWRPLLSLLGFSLTLASGLPAQQPEADPKRRTLIRLRAFAVDAQVRLSPQATLEKIDESLLRVRLEQAMRREGISIQGSGDVRDGSQAQISLVYLVLETGSELDGTAGFAASSCLQLSQLVTIPRLGAYHYAMAPTWSSCGMIVGGRDSFRASILQNADQQIARFLSDWRAVNPALDRSDGRADGRTGGRVDGRIQRVA
jgi:hypothetical protein